MQSTTNMTHKFMQIIKYSIKGSYTQVDHRHSTVPVQMSCTINAYEATSLHGLAHQFPAIDTHNSSEKFSSIQKVRPAPVHRVQTKTPQLTIILMVILTLMAKLQHINGY